MESGTIIITGGTGIIGKEIVRLLCNEGFTIVSLSRNSDSIENNENRNAFYLKCDITKAQSIELVMEYIILNFLPISALINCAGINYLNEIDQYSEKEIRMIIETNLIGTILITKYIVPHLKRQKFGKIINISSQAGLEPQVCNSVYSMAKSGIVSFTKALAKELGRFNITVNSVCPGDIESTMMDQAISDIAKAKNKPTETIKNEIINSIPIGRMGTPQEIAEVVKHLLLIKTQYLTGTNIVVAGGRTCY